MKRIIDFRKDGLPEIDLLVGWVINRDHAFVLAHPEYKICPFKSWKLFRAISKYRSGVPLAYITGHKEFYGLDFIVNKHTLIPRPDTEIMISEAVRIINNFISQKTLPILVDIGTGSGCIPIAVLKTINNANIKTIAGDVSSGAIRTAKRNAKKHGVHINFFKSDLLSNIYLENNNSPIVITANLPYLTAEQFKTEQSIQNEPYTALVADDNNGLSLYSKLLTQINSAVQSGIKEIYLLAEIDPRQSADMQNLVRKILPQSQLEIKKDLAGYDRLVLIKISN